jgi:hypothetical protein
MAYNGLAIGAPIDQVGWQTCVADAKTATTNPYIPSAATGTIRLAMEGFTGVRVRAKYLVAGTMSTDPIVAVWGQRGSTWGILKDANGSRTTTLADTAATDCTDATYKYTDSSEKIDALGAEHVLVTVITAAVSAAGAVTIEIARY